MTPDEAIARLNNQQCPLDDATLTCVYDAYGAGDYVCSGEPRHTWPIKKIVVEYDTNYFEAELDEDAIRERLEEYAS